MNKYQSYKPSGVEWIGEIPVEWKVSKYKYNLNILSGFPFKSELFDNENGFPLLRIRDITSGTIETYYNGDFDNKYIIKKGDVVIGMDGDFNIREWDNDDILLNQRCCKIQGYNNLLLKFIYYTLPIDLKIINDLTYYTTVKHLSVDDLYNINCVLPPLQEQLQIVQFLDEKTELIDKLISTKERKITLLKEQRTSLINQVVTKGLNSNVKMKDSGVEWIGEIPEHWRFIKFSYLISKSDLGGNYDSSSEGDGFPLMKMGNLGRGKINLKKIEYLNNDEYDISHKLEDGDFLFNTRNSIDLVGKVSLWRNELEFSLYNSNILRISFKNGVDNEFMCYLFNSQSILDVLKLISKGTTSVSGIYYKDLSEIKICIPSIEEQLQIVEHLDFKTKEIDDLVHLEQKKIDLLKEYRQSLISEVVTGKIKVTN